MPPVPKINSSIKRDSTHKPSFFQEKKSGFLLLKAEPLSKLRIKLLPTGHSLRLLLIFASEVRLIPEKHSARAPGTKGDGFNFRKLQNYGVFQFSKQRDKISY